MTGNEYICKPCSKKHRKEVKHDGFENTRYELIDCVSRLQVGDHPPAAFTAWVQQNGSDIK